VELIIHIGDAKCGSSSIQKSLCQANDLLRSNNILYHTPEYSTSHSAYLSLNGRNTRVNEFTSRRRATRNIEDIRTLVKNLDIDYVILSSEYFFNLSVGEIYYYLSKLKLTITGVHIIGYVRTPDSMYLAMQQQKLKASHYITPPDKYRRDIVAIFNEWEPLSKSVHVRLFNKITSVVQDFGQVLESITGLKIDLPEVVINESLSAEQMIVLQKFRQKYLAGRDEQFSDLSNDLIKEFRKMNILYLLGTKPKLTDSARGAIFRGNQDIIEEFDYNFPNLQLGNLCLAGDIEYDWKVDDVSTILQDYQQFIVEYLTLTYNSS